MHTQTQKDVSDSRSSEKVSSVQLANEAAVNDFHDTGASDPDRSRSNTDSDDWFPRHRSSRYSELTKSIWHTTGEVHC